MGIPDLVESKPGTMMGKPCFKGTRIPVYLILEKLAAEESTQTILEAYPQLTKAHLAAALRFAAVLAAEELSAR